MKFLFDLFPVILFFGAFKIYDIYVATAVAIAATFVQIGWTWFRYRKVDNMLWISLVVIMLLGGATLMFQDETFIKWKPTVLYGLFAIVLLVSNSFFKKNLIKTMLEKQITLPVSVWSRLNISWVAFFIFMGGINLHVAYNYSIDTWVNFKLFGSVGLMLVFVVIQGMMIGKYIKESEDNKLMVTLENDNSLECEMVEEHFVKKKGKDE